MKIFTNNKYSNKNYNKNTIFKKIYKYFFKTILLLLVFHISLLNIHSFAKNELNINLENVPTECEAVIIYDITTNEILYSKNIKKRMYPASITKLLTGLLACEYGNLKDTVTFNLDATTLEIGSSTLSFTAGEKITLKDALYGLMLKSANEVANQMQYYISEKSGLEFKDATEKKLKEIGAFETIFTSPSGLHRDTHYTTAYDMALIAKAAYENEDFRKVFSSKSYTIPQTNKFDSRTCYNTHKMIFSSSPYYLKSVIGGKTGFTGEALNTLVTFSEHDELKLISVTLKGNGTSVTFGDTKNLLTYFNENYVTKTFYKKGEVFKTIPLIDKDGNKLKDIKLTLENDLILTLPANWNEKSINNFNSNNDNDKNNDNIENNAEINDDTTEKIDKLDIDENVNEDGIQNEDIFNYENDLFKLTLTLPDNLTTSVLKDSVIGNLKIELNNGSEKTISILTLDNVTLNESNFDFSFIYMILFIIAAVTIVIYIIKFIDLIKEEKAIK